MVPDLVPRALPGRCNPLQPARAGALGAGGLGRSAAAWRDEGRAPGSGLYQERIPRRHLRVLRRPDAAIRCIASPLKWFSCGVGGSGRQPIQSADPQGPAGGEARRERIGENFYVEASEHSLCTAGGWWPQGVQGALAGRPELVLPLQPFACSRLGGSGELLGGSEGGPEGARGRSWESPRATFRGSEGSLSGLAEVCWHISGSSGHL